MPVNTPKTLLQLTRTIHDEHIDFSVIKKTLKNIYKSRPLLYLVYNGVKMNCKCHSFAHFCNQLYIEMFPCHTKKSKTNSVSP